MKAPTNLIIAALPRSGVWGADDCGGPSNLLAVSDKCQEKLPQQFSEPTSDFLAWGAQPVRRSKSSDEARLPPLREKTRSPKSETGFGQGFSVRKRSAVRGGSLGLRGAPQAQRGAIARACVQQAAQNTCKAASSGATACLVRSGEDIFSPKKSAVELTHNIAIGHCHSNFIGDSNHV